VPLALIIIGIVLVISAYRNTLDDVGKLLVGDFTGDTNFLYWFGAIMTLGLLGYAPVMRAPSRAFLALILLAMFVSNNGFWAKFTDAIKTAKADTTAAKDTTPQLTGSLPIKVEGNGTAGASGIGQTASSAGSLLTTAETAFSLFA
jgi:hypothetical protein